MCRLGEWGAGGLSGSPAHTQGAGVPLLHSSPVAPLSLLLSSATNDQHCGRALGSHPAQPGRAHLREDEKRQRAPRQATCEWTVPLRWFPSPSSFERWKLSALEECADCWPEGGGESPIFLKAKCDGVLFRFLTCFPLNGNGVFIKEHFHFFNFFLSIFLSITFTCSPFSFKCSLNYWHIYIYINLGFVVKNFR